MFDFSSHFFNLVSSADHLKRAAELARSWLFKRSHDIHSIVKFP